MIDSWKNRSDAWQTPRCPVRPVRSALQRAFSMTRTATAAGKTSTRRSCVGLRPSVCRAFRKAQLLNISLSLIHRKALFEYLRDEQVRGSRRQQIMAHFFSHRDYTSAVVAEHGRYVRSAASYLCSSHVGSHVMFDALFEAPLAEYEDLYASYFRTYCSAVLASDDNAVAKSMLPVVVDLKAQIGEWRKALIALTHSQSGVWRRPIL